MNSVNDKDAGTATVEREKGDSDLIANEKKKKTEVDKSVEDKKKEADIEEESKVGEKEEKMKEGKREEKQKEAETKEKKNEAVTEKKKEENTVAQKKNEAVTEEKQKESKEGEAKMEGREKGAEMEDKIKETEKKEGKKDLKKDEAETDEKKKEAESEDSSASEKSPPLGDERRCLYDLKEYEKNALFEFRSKIEEAILENKILKKKDHVSNPEQQNKGKEAEGSAEKQEKEPENISEQETEKHKKLAEQKTDIEIDREISLWGVPLLPSKEDDATDTVLLKFLRARDFRANDAFEMLRSTLQWRKENNIDSILEENFGDEFSCFAFMGSQDREGQPVCFNIYGVFGEEGAFDKMVGTEEKRNRFLRWRIQLMEGGIKQLDLRPGGVSSMLQINDLSNTPLPSKKELRVIVKQAIAVFQDNYPEFVSRNVFVNVPFWYYAFTAIFSPFLTQRTKSKFVYARPTKVNETLLKYVAGERIPVQLGGLYRDNDSEFCVDDITTEAMIKSGSKETIEIPAPEVGGTLVWDVCVQGGEVNYREEFVPTNEKSYTIIVKKERKIGWQEGLIRNSFKNPEPGKILILLDNTSFKKKHLLYRFKTTN